jgi:hypothetical protein
MDQTMLFIIPGGFWGAKGLGFVSKGKSFVTKVIDCITKGTTA